MLQIAGTSAIAQTLVGDGTVICGGPYTVKSGDTLSKVANRAYGFSDLYTRILDANT